MSTGHYKNSKSYFFSELLHKDSIRIFFSFVRLNIAVTQDYIYTTPVYKLTLKVLVTTIDAQWEGMGDVGSARYEPALHPHARP